MKEHAWFAGNSDDRTHPVGKKKANAWGLYDMYGNVPEWCWDRYAADYYKDMPASDPPGSGKGRERVFRGDAWNSVLPRTSARPALGWMMFMTVLMAVLFPAPLGPTRAKTEPAGTSNVTP